MKSREWREAERRKYEADVDYAVWRQGGNTDHVSYERVEDAYYAGRDAETVAAAEVARQHSQRQVEPEPDEEAR